MKFMIRFLYERNQHTFYSWHSRRSTAGILPYSEFKSPTLPTLKNHVRYEIRLECKKQSHNKPPQPHSRYCALQHHWWNKVMNGPSGQWVKEMPRTICPVPPNGFLPPSNRSRYIIKAISSSRPAALHSRTVTITTNRCRVTVSALFFLLKMFVYFLTWLWSAILREVSATVLAVFLAVLLAVRTLQILREASSLPPGPWGIPILGCLPFLKGDLHLYLSDLTQKYGSLISTRLGSQLIVVLSDYKMIRDTFRKEEFTGRPKTEFMSILDGYGKWNGFFITQTRVLTKILIIRCD